MVANSADHISTKRKTLNSIAVGLAWPKSIIILMFAEGKVKEWVAWVFM